MVNTSHQLISNCK